MNSTVTTASSVPPSTPNLKPPQPKPQTAKEVIAANVKALIEQLDAGHSDALTAYLNAMSRFHNYSSATSSKSHGRNRTQPALPGSGHGNSLAVR